MPKTSLPPLPISALFAVAKPSGPTSMSVINQIKELCAQSKLFATKEQLDKINNGQKVPKRGRRVKDFIKIGQGGTLDPLADGVLVIGIGKGTKKLSHFLDCTKEYKTTCLLGCETDTYDSEGARVRTTPWKHVTRAKVEDALKQFCGDIKQTPPIFSALKMDGKPLYEYARQGIPLPRAIEERSVTVHSLELVDWLGSNHHFSWPEKQLTEHEKEAMEKALQGIEDNPSLQDNLEEPDNTDAAPTAFVLKMTVSGGTYVRSIVHDLAHALGSAGHVVTLTRSRQGQFVLQKDDATSEEYECVPWEVVEQAHKDAGPTDEEGWTEWERRVMDLLEVVPS